MDAEERDPIDCIVMLPSSYFWIPTSSVEFSSSTWLYGWLNEWMMHLLYVIVCVHSNVIHCWSLLLCLFV